MMSLLVAWLVSAAADPAQLGLPGLQFNEKLHLVAADGVFKNEEVEVRIQSVRLPNPALAAKKARTDLYNIQSLYKPRTNPYQGQVSELIECGEDLKPKTESIRIKGVETTLLTGGASARRTFGVCAPAEIAFWGGYFEFFHAPAQAAVEVRVFIKKEAAPTLAAGRDKLARLSRELFR